MAIPAQGRGSYIGFAEEVTFGTAVARTNWRPVVSVGLQTQQRRSPIPDLHAGGVLPRRPFTVSDESGGAARLVATYDNIGMILKAALGAVTDGGAGPSSYTHDYTLASALPSLTVEVVRGNSTNSEVFEGVQISSATLSVEVGQPMFVELDMLAETSAARAAAGSPSLSATETPIIHSHAGQLSFDGANYDLISLRVALSNSLDRRPKLGSTESQEFARTGYGSVVIECTVEAVLNQNDTLLVAQRAGTQGDTAVAFTSGGRSLTITGQNAYIDEASDPVGDAGIIRQRLRFVCESDGTDLGLKLAIVNSESSGTAN